MAIYHLSMGFLWPTIGSYKGWGGQLFNGAVLAGTPSTVSNFGGLTSGDQIQFWIYDLNQSGAVPSLPSTFPNGDPWITIAPTTSDPTLFTNGGSQPNDPPSLTSGVTLQQHGPFATVWFAQPNLGGGLNASGYPGTYPCWTLIQTINGSQPLAGLVDPNDTDDPGSFNVTLQISVSLSGGTPVIYGHDPTMVVDPTNQST